MWLTIVLSNIRNTWYSIRVTPRFLSRCRRVLFSLSLSLFRNFDRSTVSNRMTFNDFFWNSLLRQPVYPLYALNRESVVFRPPSWISVTPGLSSSPRVNAGIGNSVTGSRSIYNWGEIAGILEFEKHFVILPETWQCYCLERSKYCAWPRSKNLYRLNALQTRILLCLPRKSIGPLTLKQRASNSFFWKGERKKKWF